MKAPRIKDVVITPDMLNKISAIDRFNGAWEGRREGLTPVELRMMKRVATIESVGSSNRIEGNRMTDEEVEALFSHIEQKSFQTRDEEEVAGYADLVNTIFENYTELPLSENYIKQLHQILLRYSSKDERHRGEYKTDSNRVAAFDAAGREIGSIFETATPFDTPRLMRDLVAWTNDTLQDRYFHPLVTIGIFIVHFLAIHPFTDGNGRLSRALTILLMLRLGYEYLPYSSMESIVESSKEAYYRSLRGTQRTLHSESVNYEPWLSYFMASLYGQKCNLEAKIAVLKQQNKRELSGTSQAVMSLFIDKHALSMADIVLRLNMNPETIRKAVQSMVKKGYLKKMGTTRGATYARSQPLTGGEGEV